MLHSRICCISVLVLVISCTVATTPAEATVTKKLYVDGVPMGSNTVPGALSYTYARITLASEGNRWSMYNVLDGALDEFAVYEGVLGPVEVLDHYNAYLVDEPNYVAEVRSDNPLIYLRLDDPNSLDGAPAYCDPCSAVIRNGTYVSDSNVIMQVPGIFGTDKAAKFGGDSNAGCIDLWDGDKAFSHEEISIEVWVKSSQLDDNYPRLFQHNGAWDNERAYGVMTNDANGVEPGGMQAGVIGAQDTSYLATGDINNDAWHHIVVTYAFTYDPNGYDVEVAKDSPLIWFRFEQDDIAHDVNVVNDGSKTVPAKFLGAAAPQPRSAPGIAGKGVFLNDETQNTVLITSPKYEQGGEDYDHDYALTPGDMSVEVWFRSAPYYEYNGGGELNWSRLFSNNGNWRYLAAGRVMMTYNAYGVFCGGDGTNPGEGEVGFWFTHPGFDPQADPNQATGPADTLWHHTVTIFDVNDTNGHDPNTDPLIVVQFYLDGVLLGSRVQEPCAPNDITAILGPEFREFLIGAEAHSGNRYNCFRGSMDEFALYDHVLPEERVSIHYLEGMAAPAWTPETCEEVLEQNWGMAADLNQDCRVNFKDIVYVANDWWRCMGYDCPGGSECDESCETPWLE